jgi:competence protein ComEA
VERSRGTIAIWVVAAGLALLAGTRLLGGGGDPPPPPVRVDEPSAVQSGRRGGGGGVFVHVAGAVRRPGLYRVPASSRVAAAVRQAGGFERGADTTAVNLAAEVEDGQQVVVPRTAATASPGAPNAPLNLATATADQLDEIDGIGPTLAERIIEHRDAAGGLASVEDLREVEGIGEKRLETLREALGQ